MTFTHVTFAMDLALSELGFAILAISDGEPILLDKSFVKTRGKAHGEQLVEIADEVLRYISKYEPGHLVREKSFSRFPAASQAIYKVNGVVDYVIEDFHEETGTPSITDEIAATSVKKLVTGNGRASKEDVAEAVFKRLQITNTDAFYVTRRNGRVDLIDDLTDACAAGLAYYIEKGLIE